MLIIPVLQKLKQGDHEFDSSLKKNKTYLRTPLAQKKAGNEKKEQIYALKNSKMINLNTILSNYYINCKWPK